MCLSEFSLDLIVVGAWVGVCSIGTDSTAREIERGVSLGFTGRGRPWEYLGAELSANSLSYSYWSAPGVPSGSVGLVNQHTLPMIVAHYRIQDRGECLGIQACTCCGNCSQERLAD